MTTSQPLVCIFFKLPPRHQSVLRIHEIAWNVFLPQMNRLSQALDAVQATHSSPEVKKIWSEVRRRAAGMVDKLERIGIMNYNAAFAFLAFLNAVHDGRDGSGPYENFRSCTSQIVDESRKVQDVMLNFREEIRIAAGRIASILSSDDKDVSSFVTECSQSLLEFATGVEECSAILEEHREEVKEVQRQSFDQKDNRPSEDEFRMLLTAWFKTLSTHGHSPPSAPGDRPASHTPGALTILDDQAQRSVMPPVQVLDARRCRLERLAYVNFPCDPYGIDDQI
ncbi:hypothetical protein AGABI1DRAFT_128747 [Agaricus bisporus var. burnettii JB137-S8]|uniref:Uncharacterized protein n=1 Tax=Agaricus bisporus var. burnettii (strain JB137-S8 / ATCC MYA-4627 / FGSC 10392) TaxID=597362 RepID=K5X8U0_AGABU|nr:uncharacterized protein AGABI1DRAFT_128747 [Agaricus bisporus var. burnettii JB137-S8]EKM79603.1 hypothetical protein AGABI1DRAFT_128747 [Agaricus bisporus var. burnettii JB137-S8]